MKNKNKKSNDVVPKVFEFRYGACLSLLNFNMKIDNGKILPADEYFLFPNTDKDIIPSEKEWQVFWKKIDKIGLWNWQESYTPQNMIVFDGYHWNLRIELGDRKIECSGSNAYPGEEIGEIVDMNKSKSFKRFLNAIKKLTGLEIKNMGTKEIKKSI